MNIQCHPTTNKSNNKHIVVDKFPHVPAFKGAQGDIFVSKNKEEKLKSLFDRIGSYFFKGKESDYINKAEVKKIFVDAGFYEDVYYLDNILNETKEKKGYSKTAIENIIKILKRTNSFDGMNIIKKCSIGINKKRINHESQRAFLSVSLKIVNVA